MSRARIDVVTVLLLLGAVGMLVVFVSVALDVVSVTRGIVEELLAG